MWSTPVETLVNISVLLTESYHITFIFLFAWFIVLRLIGYSWRLNMTHIRHFERVVRYSNVPDVLSVKWKCTWGFMVCYLRSKRVPYFKN